MILNLTVNVEVEIEDDWLLECWNDAGLATQEDQLSDAISCASDTVRERVSHYQHYDPVRCKVVEISQTETGGEI